LILIPIERFEIGSSDLEDEANQTAKVGAKQKV